MTPTKALIAQRLDEVAAELQAIAELSSDFKTDPLWNGHIQELLNAADLTHYLAADIRREP